MRSYVTAALILAGGGAVISTFQKQILTEEEEKGLLPAPLIQYDGSGKVKKLEQQLFFVSLGGLRSLVAAFLAVNAHDYFCVKDWARLADRYHQVVALSPQNTFYWENGSWHMAYNATSSSLDDRRLRETERRIRFRKYLNMGRDFLREGIRNNPDDWFLHKRLGDTLSDRMRLPDYAGAAEAYEAALEKGAPSMVSRSVLYSLAQVPGRERQAYELARDLFVKGHRVPTVECLLFAYQNSLDIPREDRLTVQEIFYSPRSAESSLRTYSLMDVAFPKAGVKEAVALLEPRKKSTAWSSVPLSDLERISFYSKKTQQTLP